MAYQLTYFNMRGRGEPIRWILKHVGAEYSEDTIDPLKDWMRRKKDFLWGRVPVLKVDGSEVFQTLVICRLLAERHDLLPSGDAVQRARVEEVAGFVQDLSEGFSETFRRRLSDTDSMKEVAKATGVRILEVMAVTEGTITEEGWIRSQKMTWVDIFTACVVDLLKDYIPGLLENYPKVKALHEKISSHPRIAEWIEERPPYSPFENPKGIEFV